MPMQAMWSGGSDVPRSALPSFVQTTKPPVSAMREVDAGEAGLGGEKLFAQALAGGLGEVGGVGGALLGAELAVEELADVFLLDVDRRQHDVARVFVPQLDDPLAEVGVGDLDAVLFEDTD